MQARIFILSVAFFCSCANNTSTQQKNNTDTTSSTGVETRKANTHYPSAFEGQTRINAARTNTAYIVDELASDLEYPWAIIPFSNDRFLISSRMGYMQIHDSSGTFIRKITGFPDVDSRGQGGLLDVALDPAFEKNHLIYWSFSEKQQDKNLMAVAKGTLNEEKGVVENPTVIFRATPALNSTYHFGSRIIFDKNGDLFVSTGERSILEGRSQAQLLSSGLGKIFHITTDGKAAADNPFINNKDAMPQIYAYGIRNCQSLDIHPVTGELWEAEFGPRGGDEVNIIRAGNNYGWPVITYGIEYSGETIGEAIQQKEGMQQPVYYWDPTVSPSGMTFYKGNTIPEWENNLFISCLSGQCITRLVIINNKITGEERLLSDKGERFRDITYHNGMLFTVTDNGKLYRISKN